MMGVTVTKLEPELDDVQHHEGFISVSTCPRTDNTRRVKTVDESTQSSPSIKPSKLSPTLKVGLLRKVRLMERDYTECSHTKVPERDSNNFNVHLPSANGKERYREDKYPDCQKRLNSWERPKDDYFGMQCPSYISRDQPSSRSNRPIRRPHSSCKLERTRTRMNDSHRRKYIDGRHVQWHRADTLDMPPTTAKYFSYSNKSIKSPDNYSSEDMYQFGNKVVERGIMMENCSGTFDASCYTT